MLWCDRERWGGEGGGGAASSAIPSVHSTKAGWLSHACSLSCPSPHHCSSATFVGECNAYPTAHDCSGGCVVVGWVGCLSPQRSPPRSDMIWCPRGWRN